MEFFLAERQRMIAAMHSSEQLAWVSLSARQWDDVSNDLQAQLVADSVANSTGDPRLLKGLPGREGYVETARIAPEVVAQAVKHADSLPAKPTSRPRSKAKTPSTPQRAEGEEESPAPSQSPSKRVKVEPSLPVEAEVPPSSEAARSAAATVAAPPHPVAPNMYTGSPHHPVMPPPYMAGGFPPGYPPSSHAPPPGAPWHMPHAAMMPAMYAPGGPAMYAPHQAPNSMGWHE
jgi:hypothetical protein